MNKHIWREVFSTRPNSTDFKILHYHPRAFVFYSILLNASEAIQDIVITLNHGESKRFIPVNQFETFIEDTFKKIITDPSWVIDANTKCVEQGEKLFKLGKRILNEDLLEKKDDELIDLHSQFVALQEAVHFLPYIAARVDLNKQLFTGYLKDLLKNATNEDDDTVMEFFTTCTTPHQLSFGQKERLDLIQLATEEKGLLDHIKKWEWLGYGYNGPVYDVSFFKKRLSDLDNVGESVQMYKNWENIISQKQEKIYKSYAVDKHIQKMFEVAQSIVYTKDYKNAAIFFACYIQDIMQKEIARRLHITTLQGNHLTPDELYHALENKNVDLDKVNDRITFSVITKNGIYTGNEAHSIFASMEIEQNIEDSNLIGVVAFPGNVRGIVKIIKNDEDLQNVKNGDIIVAQTIFPWFLPAIRRAKAVISVSGGITCHAAIVARELEKPTLVGVKNALKQLQDGEEIEFNTTKGIIIKK